MASSRASAYHVRYSAIRGRAEYVEVGDVAQFADLLDRLVEALTADRWAAAAGVVLTTCGRV